MKLLVLTDIHGRINYVNKLRKIKRDLTIISGDFTHFETINKVEKIVERLSNSTPLIFVPGNCDPKELLRIKCLDNAINVHGQFLKINNLTLIGVGGSNVTPFGTPIEFSEEELWSIVFELFKKAKSDDSSEFMILISHAPPYGTKLDVTYMGIHVGSKSIRKIIELFKPDLCICGHIHEARGIDKINRTVLLNPGPLMHGYYSIIEINDKNVSVNMANLKAK